MFRLAVLFSCLALCHSHAVLPLVVPAAHTLHTAPLVVPYPPHHGYGYGYGHGLLGHGLLAKPLTHHILKRSPHYVAPLAHIAPVAHVAPVAHIAPVAPVAPVAHIAPVAVSHQSRVDIRTSPAVVASVLPVVKPIVAPVLPYAPLVHKPLLAAPLYGAGHYGSLYPHLAHSHY